MALGTIDIQYIYNKFAGKVGVDTFFCILDKRAFCCQSGG